MTILNRFIFTKVHGLWTFVLLLCLLIQAAAWGDYVHYDSKLIADGHVWLLLSGHFVHLNWSHWALNMAGLVIVAFFFSAYGSVFQWLVVILISSLFVSFGLYWFHPEIRWYVGMSGVLHGLFLYGALREIKAYPLSGYVLLVLLVVKLAWEVMNGALPGSEEMTGGSVITDAHLYGAIGGVVSALILWVLTVCRRPLY